MLRRGKSELTPLRGPALITTLMVLALANFMSLLDMTIVNVAVPNIAGSLGVSPSQGTWVITSYAVAEAITVPLTGWLAQRFGTVRTFVTAMFFFAAFSCLCGLAPSFGALVLCRILQGLAGGPMMPLSQTIVMRVTPPELRSQAMGLWIMTTVAAPIAGPLVGGTIADTWGWAWAFYINVPIGALCVFLVWRTLGDRETATVKNPFDYIGLALLILFVGSLQLMFDKGKELDWFNSPFIVGLAAIAAIGFVAFLIWELTEEHPVVDLNVFRYPSFTLGCTVMAVAYGAFFASIVIVPLWLQTNLGYTSRWAGYVTALNGLMVVLIAPFVARVVDKMDPRPLISGGLVWVAFVMFLRTGFASNINFGHVIVPNLLQGIGMPFFFLPLMTLALWPLKPQEYAAGAGLMTFLRTTSGAFATSLVATLWENAGTEHRVAIVNEISGDRAVQHSLNVPGMTAEQNVRMLDNMVQSQSVMTATNHIFEIVAVLLLFAAALTWIAPKPAKASVRGGPGH
jgi:DHA2 family multidrug resistance protein